MICRWFYCALAGLQVNTVISVDHSNCKTKILRIQTYITVVYSKLGSTLIISLLVHSALHYFMVNRTSVNKKPERHTTSQSKFERYCLMTLCSLRTSVTSSFIRVPGYPASHCRNFCLRRAVFVSHRANVLPTLICPDLERTFLLDS